MDKTLKDFFDEIKTGKISKLESYNHLKVITNNFEEIPLRLFEEDYSFYLFLEKEKKLAQYSEKDMENAVTEFGKKGLEIPLIEVRKLKIRGLETKGFSVLDTERLLYPTYFFFCYEFERSSE